MSGILLDTNVISEVVRPAPDGRVVAWMESSDPENLYLSVFTLGELQLGAGRLAPGKRRLALEAWIERDLVAQFDGRIVVFDREAALIWGRLMAAADRRGRPRPFADARIAACARRHGMSLATRNAGDFTDMEVDLIDPWRP